MRCKRCGNRYEKITTHWSKSKCNHPEIQHHELLQGLLMGDATVDDKFDERRNPRLRLAMTNKDYLDYLYNKMEYLFTREPYVHRTSEELAKNVHENSFTNSKNPQDFKTQYKIQTISHPEIERYEKWYSTGEKVFPEDIELTPTTLKHWYVCDGSYNNNGSRRFLRIHCSNERKNKEKINRMFEEKGFTEFRWREDQTKHGSWRASISFTVKDTEKIFDYMGRSPPGFAYKWRN